MICPRFAAQPLSLVQRLPWACQQDCRFEFLARVRGQGQGTAFRNSDALLYAATAIINSPAGPVVRE
jgi:hypothetical protein